MQEIPKHTKKDKTNTQEFSQYENEYTNKNTQKYNKNTKNIRKQKYNNLEK